jgi:alpha-methylacyl-CoA racemase
MQATDDSTGDGIGSMGSAMGAALSSDPLEGVRIVSIALNLPGPFALRRLADFGATAKKIEPPDGDPMKIYALDYYRELHEGIAVEHLDLKSDEGQRKLSAALENADLFLTSQRPSALERLGLSPVNVRRLWPHLSQLAVVGHLPPYENRPGHDLTYLAETGLIRAPLLPPTLMADLLGAERAVSAAFALLALSKRSGHGEYAQVALEEAAHVLSGPLRHGLTREGGLLGGAHPGYKLYRTKNGWIALAALEPHFLSRAAEALGVDEPGTRAFADRFVARTSEEWRYWAEQHDIPLTVI